MSEYTDKERMKIAQKEYPEYNNGKLLKEGQTVEINNGKTIGYVAEANHNDDTGEDSFVIKNTKDAVGVVCALLPGTQGVVCVAGFSSRLVFMVLGNHYLGVGIVISAFESGAAAGTVSGAGPVICV